MTIVTCDIVESAAAAKDVLKAEVTTLLPTVAYAKSMMIWSISSLLVTSAVAVDAAYLQPVANIVERAVATDAAVQRADLSMLVVERARATDTEFVLPEALVVDQARGTSAVILSRDVGVVERARATDAITYNRAATVLTTERARARDVLFGFNDYDIVEHAAGASTALLSSSFAQTVTERAAGADELLVGGAVEFVFTERAAGSVSLLTQTIASAYVTERLAARDKLLIDTLTMAWAMNTESFGMTRYTGLPFSSLAVVNGRVLGLGDTGLFVLEGENDDGVQIDALVTTGLSMLGDSAVKRIPEIYFTGSMQDEMSLAVGVYGAKKGTYTYTVPKRTADAPRGNRAVLGKGLASVYWKFTITNKNGADFNIDTITADVAPSTTRRI